MTGGTDAIAALAGLIEDLKSEVDVLSIRVDELRQALEAGPTREAREALDLALSFLRPALRHDVDVATLASLIHRTQTQERQQ